MKRTACLLLMLLASGLGNAFAQAGPPPQAKGEFKTAVGESVGNVTMTQMPDGMVLVNVSVRGLPPGEHGIHIHAVGSCSPNFAAAGPHFNPANKHHGLENPNGPHAGDLPNLTVLPDGTATYQAMTNRATIAPGPLSIFDADGSALVIHAGMDDQKTDPAGNSGERIACAVLRPVSAVQPPAQIPAQTRATAEFKTMAGETVGNATLTQNGDGSVRVQVQVRGLPAGTHGIHFHQFGACAPTFGAAGEHVNPQGRMHGLENPAGPHAGDLPNLTVGANGTGSLDTTTNMVTVSPGATSIFDADGTALVIHAFADDEKTDPSGKSGPRIACAVVMPGTATTMGAQAGGGNQSGTGQPARLPNTGESETPRLTLLSVGLLLLCLGGLAVHASRRKQRKDAM